MNVSSTVLSVVKTIFGRKKIWKICQLYIKTYSKMPCQLWYEVCISPESKSDLHIIEGWINSMTYWKTLENKLLPFKYSLLNCRNQILKQDSDPVMRSISNWFSKKWNGILNWPANPPNLNTIKNVKWRNSEMF